MGSHAKNIEEVEFDKDDIVDSAQDIQLKAEEILEKWQADLLVLGQ